MDHPISKPENLPPGTEFFASPRFKEVVESATADLSEEELRNLFDLGVCRQCTEEIIIIGGSADICAQCYLGVEHINRENIELVTNLELNISKEEFSEGFRFFVLDPHGPQKTPETFYMMNAKLVMNGYPMEWPEEHEEGMADATRKLILEAISGEIGEDNPVLELIKEAMGSCKAKIDTEHKTITIGAQITADGLKPMSLDAMTFLSPETLDRLLDKDNE